MNKKIAMSAISIMGSLAIMGGVTFALFDDSVTATNNTFAAGNADLKIAPDATGSPGPYADTIPGPNFSGMFPGQTKTFEFWLKNESLSAIDLDLTADVEDILPSGDGDQVIDNALLVSWVCDTSGNGGLEEAPTAEFSPRDWFNGGDASVGTLIPGDEMICRMFGRLPSDTDNAVAGQSVEFDVRYGATQVPLPSPS